MAAAMVRHDALFESIVERHGGAVVRPRGEGDSRFAVFERAGGAAAAIAEFQQAMFSEQWPTSTTLRVRAALHTGEAALRDGDYYGSTVNRCARLRALAQGGQTLLSQTTTQLIWENLPAGVTCLDLGEHTLKDLTRPERVYQLVIPGVPSEFPPLQNITVRPINLPIPATTFVGRERQIDAVCRRLLDPTVRLVTLIGPGGAGKTRLAMHVAEDAVGTFTDGVYFVWLSSIQEPALLIPTIAMTLGVREVSGEQVADTLHNFLRGKNMLLVLDNFDHVVDAAPELVQLLSACPLLKILVTSRVTLHIRGNQEISVPPLDLPNLRRLPPAERLAEIEAVRLFVERARDIQPDFELTDDNAADVAAIVDRLDGLPLAIELAAARIRLFSPHTLLARLDRRLPLLTGGAIDLPERQQTLRGTIAWSYDLLDERERQLFRRLSVFAGGFTLEAAEAVAGAHSVAVDSVGIGSGGGEVGALQVDEPAFELDVLNVLDSLVSQSLVRPARMPAGSSEARFRMLETIREFGLEQLAMEGETGSVSRMHAMFFLQLAEAAEPALKGPEQATWLDRLRVEHGNLRAALEWSIGANEPNGAARLAGALWPFWAVRGYFSEGRQWMDRVLGLGADDQWQVKVLTGAGSMAWSQGDFAKAEECHGEALELNRRLGDTSGIAFSLNNLGVQAEALGDRGRAIALYQESLELHRQLGNELGIAYALNNLGALAWEESDFDEAARLFEESLAIRRKLGDHQRVADGLYNLGEIAYAQQDYARATSLYQESLALRRSLGSRWGAALGLAALAAVAAMQGRLERAAKLGGAAEALFQETGLSLDLSERSRFDQTMGMLRQAMGDSAFERRWMEGRSMSEDAAIEFGLVADDLPHSTTSIAT